MIPIYGCRFCSRFVRLNFVHARGNKRTWWRNKNCPFGESRRLDANLWAKTERVLCTENMIRWLLGYDPKPEIIMFDVNWIGRHKMSCNVDFVVCRKLLVAYTNPVFVTWFLQWLTKLFQLDILLYKFFCLVKVSGTYRELIVHFLTTNNLLVPPLFRY